MLNKILFILLLLLLSTSYSKSNIKIKYKIGDEIITNFDILDEKKYLIFLRPNLSKLPEKEILKISENSLIREIIKKRELDKVYKNLNESKFLQEIKKNLFSYKNVRNESEFIALLKENNIEYQKIIQKMKYEGLWNELISQKYGSLLKINKRSLKEKLKNKKLKNKKFEYELYEILFEIKNSNDLNSKYVEIMKYIKLNGFKAAASKYSISNSSNKGGEIGWVKETYLSEELSKFLNKMKKGQITQPIKYPNGFLLLKINNKKEMKQILDEEKALNEIISFERNKQLTQFSLLLFKKLKQNTIINEY